MTAEWMDQAACLEADPEVMQPEHATSAGIREAIETFCHVCPVRRECTELAESQTPNAYGIHGGKWWGPPAKVAGDCTWCGKQMPARAWDTGRRMYCGSTCRVAAMRARQAMSA